MAQPVKPTKIADVIVHQLESLILEGTFKPGERLPPERELSERFQVSRPSLREAIRKLEARGMVQTRRGGGTYVTRLLDASFTQPLAGLLQNHPEALRDLLEMRQALEGIAAYYAALRRTPADQEILTLRLEALQNVYVLQEPNTLSEARADAEFHLAITEAAHNVVLLHIMRGLFELLHSSVLTALTLLHSRRGSREVVQEQHAQLYQAIIAGDAEATRAAAERHITYVKQIIYEVDEESQRQARANRRLQGLLE